jgi:hypothetical protein
MRSTAKKIKRSAVCAAAGNTYDSQHREDRDGHCGLPDLMLRTHEVKAVNAKIFNPAKTEQEARPIRLALWST